MIQLDGFFVYETGYSLNPLTGVRPGAKFEEWLVPLYIAENALDTLLNKSVFSLKTSRAAGDKLLQTIRGLTETADRKEPFSHWEAYQITSGINDFQTVLKAELGLMDIYLVLKKRGYDTSDLINRGWVLFPEDLPRKVAEAIPDLVAGARCLAFELNTAAGFHLHRANESVLHRYYDAVTNGAPRPAGRNIGDYLVVLNQRNAGDAKVKACLRDLKDLHRNPLIHPEDSLESSDEAIALLGNIHAAVVNMLKEIPEPVPTVQALQS